MEQQPPEPAVVDLANALAARLDAHVIAMAERIRAEMERYRNVPIEDLAASLRSNTGLTLSYLTGSGEPVEFSPAMRTGRLRAVQGVPLPEVLRAYQLGFITTWDQLVLEASRAGTSAEAALLRDATRYWWLADAYSQAVTAAYRDAVAERMLEADRQRSALVAALVDGPLPGEDTVWEISQLLGFPQRGRFLVVAAEAVTAGSAPLPGLEAGCRKLGAEAAWRAQPGLEIVIVSCPAKAPVEVVLEAVREAATGRVGISPVYEQLDQTSRALRYAQVALDSLPVGLPAVRQLDDTPLTELVMTNLETTRRAVNRILGGVLSLSKEDRAMLLATARVWLDTHGSVPEAARTLFCHPNTVRNRMRRLEEHLRGPLEDPKVVAELAMAVDAIGTFPTLLEDHRHRQ